MFWIFLFKKPIQIKNIFLNNLFKILLLKSVEKVDKKQHLLKIKNIFLTFQCAKIFKQKLYLAYQIHFLFTSFVEILSKLKINPLLPFSFQ